MTDDIHGISVSNLSYSLPDGRAIFQDVSFTIPSGAHAGVIGMNGAGKSTLLSLLSGELSRKGGTVESPGSLGHLRSELFREPGTTVGRLLLAAELPDIQRLFLELGRAGELALVDGDDASGMAYAEVMERWHDRGGIERERHWDELTMSVLGVSLDDCSSRPLQELSAGQQRRLGLEAFLSAEHDVLLLDEAFNHVDVFAREELEERLMASAKTVLFASHDRVFLSRCCDSVLSLEPSETGTVCTVSTDGLAGYLGRRNGVAEQLRIAQINWQKTADKLRRNVQFYRDRASSRAGTTQRKLVNHLEDGPTRLLEKAEVGFDFAASSRSGSLLRVIDFSFEPLFGGVSLELGAHDRLAIVGRNGAGKSTLLQGIRDAYAAQRSPGGEFRDSAADDRVRFSNSAKLGLFGNEPLPEPGSTVAQWAWIRVPADMDTIEEFLVDYGLEACIDAAPATLSSGQRVCFELMLLDLGEANILLLDEPTEFLDFEASQMFVEALRKFTGALVCVTHDRWFLNEFDQVGLLGAGGLRQMADTSAYLLAP